MSVFYNDDDNYFNFNTETFRHYELINLKELVSKRASIQLWGNGYIFKSDNEQIQDKINLIENTINLLEFFFKSEKLHSSYGLVNFYLKILNDGTPYIQTCQPYALTKVSRIGGEEVSAKVYIRYIHDDFSRYLQITLDEKIIKYDNFDGNDNKISTQGEISPLPKKFITKTETLKNPYDFIPLIFSQNLPKAVLFGDSNINASYSDEVGVKNIQRFVDKTWETMHHELEFNRTRAFMSLSQTTFQSYLQNNITRKMLGDFIIQTDSNPTNPNTTAKALELMVASPQLQTYIDTIDWGINTYLRGCMYSGESDGTRQQTAMEVNTVQSNDVEVTRLKRTFRQKTYQRLFAKLLTMMFYKDGDSRTIEPNDFIFLIKENNIIDKDKQIERIQLLLQLNLITRIQALKELNGINDEQAEKLKAEIDAENKMDEDNLNLEDDNETDLEEEKLDDKESDVEKTTTIKDNNRD